MYIREVHAERSLVALRRIVRDNPLGQFTTAISSPSHPFLQSSHIPFVLDVQDESSETELGRLRGHLARANPQSKAIIEEVTESQSRSLKMDVLVIFSSPAQHYVTPKFYTQTKPDTGKVVPTWNYVAAQVYGKATVFVDPKSEETSQFLGAQINDLTRQNEQKMMDKRDLEESQEPWKVSDAPDKYIDLLKKAIIGIEIEITSMEGKFKMSQEMGQGDGEGVVQGFKSLNTEVGNQVADIVGERRALKAAN